MSFTAPVHPTIDGDDSDKSYDGYDGNVIDRRNIYVDRRTVMFSKKYPLHSAIIHGDLEAFNSLVTIRDVNESTPQGLTPLKQSLRVKNVSEALYFISYLLENGADPLIQGTANSKGSFLDESFRKKPNHIFIRFMETNFPLYWKSNFTIINRAIEVRNWELAIHAIKECNFKIDKYLVDIYCDFIHIPAIKNYFDSNYDISAIKELISEYTNNSTLHTAIEEDDVFLTKLFIKYLKVDLNTCSEDAFQTPLHLAIKGNNIKIFNMIIKSEGCNVNHSNYFRISPLVFAINLGHFHFVQTLLEAGAKMNFKGLCLKKAFEYVFKERDEEDFLSLRIMFHYRNNTSNTSFKCFSCLSERKKHNSIFEKLDLKGRTPLHLAIINKKTHIALYLISMGCNLNFADNEMKWTPLHWATKLSNLKLVKVLTNRKDCKVWQRDTEGMTPLNMAAKNGNTDIAKHLIRVYYLKGWNFFTFLPKHHPLDIPSFKGNTPLHSAVISGNTEIVKYLLTGGCSVHKNNNTGYSVLDLAISDKLNDIVEILRDHYYKLK